MLRGDGAARQKLGGELPATSGLWQGFLLRPLIAAFNPFTTGLTTEWPWQTAEMWKAQCGTWAFGLVPSLLSQLFPGSPLPLSTSSHDTAGPFMAIRVITPSLPYAISPSSKSLFFSYPLQSVLPLSSHLQLLQRVAPSSRHLWCTV